MREVVIVIGGQYGSEGKGKIVHDIVGRFAQRGKEVLCVRCGGPNSGHTTRINGVSRIFRSLPSGVEYENCIMVIPAGAVVNLNILREECEYVGFEKTRPRLLIDPMAVIVQNSDIRAETGIKDSIGSTGSGNGEALMNRMQRIDGCCVLAYHVREKFAEFATVMCVTDFMHTSPSLDIVIEGNQGFGLSLFHGTMWPFMTSRDTTAAAFCSEVGIAPMDVTEVVGVYRTFPIRVGGNSGPLYREFLNDEKLGTAWTQVARLNAVANAPVEQEMTSVTKKIRRVGMWDPLLFQRSRKINGCTSLAIMGLDRVDYAVRDKTELNELTDVCHRWLRCALGDDLKAKVRYVGTGPDSMIYTR